MKRRGFFSLVLGALCAPFLPKPKVPGLTFHKDVCIFTFGNMTKERWYSSGDGGPWVG